MQTPAERHLVQKLVSLLDSHDAGSNVPEILNVGAGQSVSIEQRLSQAGCRYVCDRLDVESCKVDFPTVRECWLCSIDVMAPVDSDRYVALFANYVLEHVANIRGASEEVYRTLSPGGCFIATIPNVLAPQFVLARHTALWFHRLVRGGWGWETEYAYESVSQLRDAFIDVGFVLEDEKYWSFVDGYLWRYPILGRLGKSWDKAITRSGSKRLMGDVCLVLRKPS